MLAGLQPDHFIEGQLGRKIGLLPVAFGSMNTDGKLFVVGRRYRLSDLGSQRCPKYPKAGVIISVLKGKSVRVRFDGRKQPVTIHRDYIDPD